MANYADSLGRAFSESRAWRYATFTLSVVCVILAFGLVYSGLHAPSWLVPQGFAMSNQKVLLKPGTVVAPENSDYMSFVALGDLGLILNWTPETIADQYGRFLNRVTPSLYASQNIQMLQEAKEFSKSNTIQSFYPAEKVRLDPITKTIKVSGFLVRWAGEKQILRQNVVYEIKYVEERGMLYVDDLKIVK